MRDVLRKKLLYGSDFPGMPSPKWCWQLGLRKMSKLARIENPFERNLQVMRHLGIPEEVFKRAEKLIRPDKLPETKKQPLDKKVD